MENNVLKPDRSNKKFLEVSIAGFKQLHSEAIAAASVGKRSFKYRGKLIRLQQAQIYLEYIAGEVGIEYKDKAWVTKKEEVKISYELSYYKKDRLVRAFMIVNGIKTETFHEILPDQPNHKLPSWTFEKAKEIYREQFVS